MNYTKKIISLCLTIILLLGCTFSMSGCSLMLISSLLTPDDEQETHVTTEDLIDENGEVNYETIEYETTIDSINENFVVLSPEVTDAYWKYYRWGDGFIGPTSQKLCGFFIISDKKIKEIEANFTFEESDIDFPKGIDPKITGFNEFNWGYSSDFNVWIADIEWMGDVYYDMNNKIIYVNVAVE